VIQIYIALILFPTGTIYYVIVLGVFSRITSLEVRMNRIRLLAVLVAIAAVSFSLGQVNRGATARVSDAAMSDHDKIEKLRLEVIELQDKLAALTQKHDAHTHRLRVGVTRSPRLIVCNYSNVLADKICRQIGDDNISVMFAPGNDAMVTTPPGP
jgi:hypothetical protein